MVFDDDIMPGKNVIKHYSSECIRLNGIMGETVRYSHFKNLSDNHSYGIRHNQEGDFIGHIWSFCGIPAN